MKPIREHQSTYLKRQQTVIINAEKKLSEGLLSDEDTRQKPCGDSKHECAGDGTTIFGNWCKLCCDRELALRKADPDREPKKVNKDPSHNRALSKIALLTVISEAEGTDWDNVKGIKNKAFEMRNYGSNQKSDNIFRLAEYCVDFVDSKEIKRAKNNGAMTYRITDKGHETLDKLKKGVKDWKENYFQFTQRMKRSRGIKANQPED